MSGMQIIYTQEKCNQAYVNIAQEM